MMEIEFHPVKKLVILQELKYNSAEDLFAEIVAGASADARIALLWAEGVVFVYSGMLPQSEEIVRERLQGTVYWDFVKYAKMDVYEKEINFGTFNIKIIKDIAPVLTDVAKKLKERL
jgi:hypothetical protein